MAISFYMLKNTHIKTIPDRTIDKFSTDITFEPFPRIIDVENPYVCDELDRKICSISGSNAFTCIGCQSMFARCIHLPQDTLFVDTNGARHTIPANQTDDEGYCLTIESDLTQTCNVYHGDLALIKLAPDQPDSMFFCNCKEPGLIGNTTILGACDVPFICDGHIDDINQPLADIKCKCDNTHIQTRNNDIPVCRTKTVQEANSDNTLDSLITITNFGDFLPNTSENFNSDIVQNLTNATYMLNPCVRCTITNQPIANGTIGRLPSSTHCSLTMRSGLKNTRNEYQGIPYKRSEFGRILRGQSGGDGILGIWWHQLFVYTRLEQFVQRMVFYFEYSEYNHEIFKLLNLDTNKTYAYHTDDLTLGVDIMVPELFTGAIPGSLCTSKWPQYWCYWNQDRPGVVYDRLPTLQLTVERLGEEANIRATAARQRPSVTHLWGKHPWEQFQALQPYLEINNMTTADGDDTYYITSNRQFRQGNNDYAPSVGMIAYGFTRTINRGPWQFGIFQTNESSDWELVQGQMTGQF